MPVIGGPGAGIAGVTEEAVADPLPELATEIVATRGEPVALRRDPFDPSRVSLGAAEILTNDFDVFFSRRETEVAADRGLVGRHSGFLGLREEVIEGDVVAGIGPVFETKIGFSLIGAVADLVQTGVSFLLGGPVGFVAGRGAGKAAEAALSPEYTLAQAAADTVNPLGQFFEQETVQRPPRASSSMLSAWRGPQSPLVDCRTCAETPRDLFVADPGRATLQRSAAAAGALPVPSPAAADPGVASDLSQTVLEDLTNRQTNLDVVARRADGDTKSSGLVLAGLGVALELLA